MKDFYIKELGKLTHQELKDFERIVIGLETISSKKIAKSLITKGYIEERGQKVICKDRFGTVTVPAYGVTLSVHMKWCNWCA